MLIPWRVGLWTRELKIFENGLKKKHHLAVVLALYHTVSIVSSDSSKDISTGGFNSLRCSTKPSVHSPVLMLEKPYNSSELASDKAIPIQLHGNVKSMYQNKMTIPCKQTWGQLIRRSDTHTLKKKQIQITPNFIKMILPAATRTSHIALRSFFCFTAECEELTQPLDELCPWSGQKCRQRAFESVVIYL